MSTGLAEAAAGGRKRESIPAVAAACELMDSDWSPWRMVLYGLTWRDYERMLDARTAARRESLHITYDRGTAELYTPGDDPGTGDFTVSIGNRHERWKKMIARLIEAAAMGFRVPVVACGNLTLNRADLDRGLEPDECYYVQNADRVQNIRELDFTSDPPPDLFIEIEVSRTVVDRLELCAALKIPEVWRFDGQTLRFFTRTGARFVESKTSLAFPKLTSDILGGYLASIGSTDDTTLCNEIFDQSRGMGS